MTSRPEELRNPELTKELLREARELAAILTVSQQTAKKDGLTGFQLLNYQIS
jgi:hypothetical protein